MLEPTFGAPRRERSPTARASNAWAESWADDGIAVSCDLVEDPNVLLAISAFARRHGAPLLALSSRRRYPEERYEESSVTAAIARIASCPVLVVGPAVMVPPSNASSRDSAGRSKEGVQ